MIKKYDAYEMIVWYISDGRAAKFGTPVTKEHDEGITKNIETHGINLYNTVAVTDDITDLPDWVAPPE